MSKSINGSPKKFIANAPNSMVNVVSINARLSNRHFAERMRPVNKVFVTHDMFIMEKYIKKLALHHI
jgi:hypothetical protein